MRREEEYRMLDGQIERLTKERDAALAKFTQLLTEFRDWAREKGRGHHKLAVEKRDDEIGATYNALSSAYFSLVDEIDKRLEEKPIPMCKPDALEDLFPEGGTPT